MASFEEHPLMSKLRGSYHRALNAYERALDINEYGTILDRNSHIREQNQHLETAKREISDVIAQVTVSNLDPKEKRDHTLIMESYLFNVNTWGQQIQKLLCPQRN